MKIKIITDSTSDIPKDILEKLDVEIVPLTVNFQDANYKDGIDISREDFYKKLRTSNELPTTSQVSPGEFLEVFKKNLREYDHIICLSLSSVLSGTHNAATVAKDMLETDKISIIDTKVVSFALGLIVVKAAEAVAENKSLEEILKEIDYNVENIQLKFAVDNLDNLLKGGRLSKTEAILGGLLNVKPIIALRDGNLKSEDKVRGRKKVYKWFLDDLEKAFPTKEIDLLSFVDSSDEYLAILEEELDKKFNVKHKIRAKVGSVVGTHAGEGALGIVYITKK